MVLSGSKAKSEKEILKRRGNFKADRILVVTEVPIIFTVRESVRRHQIVETGGPSAVTQHRHTALVP